MSDPAKSLALWIAPPLLAAICSCNRGPVAAKQPSIDPSSAGTMAMLNAPLTHRRFANR